MTPALGSTSSVVFDEGKQLNALLSLPSFQWAEFHEKMNNQKEIDAEPYLHCLTHQ